ncbi:MAG: hypothetical protein A2V70_04320 [Planctomycetes bacterium RBG_13_63_9]|nr:MAG: hypothetical protein A2V70_04320 [Planctomycetes bacterium RBG_13_63_9]
MTIAALIEKADNVEIVRDAIAAILAVETAQQQALAASVAATPTRVDASDYTATASKDAGAKLQDGQYVATAGTLVAGVGTWTCVSPGGTSEECTTVAAHDDLLFPGLGITFAVTVGSTPWDTGDILTVWAPDPELFRLRLYKERIEPWGSYLSTPASGTVDASPIVNVSWDTESFIEADSDYIERQSAEAKFNIDVYGYGIAASSGSSGHVPADVKAAAERDRATRLVRNILMAADYYELGLDMIGTVSKRFIQSITALDLTDSERRPIQQVRAARIVLGVTFNELSPQIELVLCAGILSRVHTELDGEVVFSIQQWFGD